MASHFHHRPVLLEESLSLLALRPGAVVVDGTVGGGGHAESILERTAPDGIVIALDVDEEAMEAAAERLRPFRDRARLVRASFRDLDAVLEQADVARVDAVLFDLGVSSPQLDAPARGFRFSEDSADETPLDMRMDRRAARTAAELLRDTPPEELERWFREHSDLPGARRLAREITAARRERPLRTTRDLLDVIESSRIGRGRRHHPATLVFQALRIAVNDELGALGDGMESAIEALAPGGRVAVIAYHSAEDRIVKNRLRDAARGCVCPPRMPVCICGQLPRVRVLTRRPIAASDDEIRANPRARSARLRAAVRLPEAA